MDANAVADGIVGLFELHEDKKYSVEERKQFLQIIEITVRRVYYAGVEKGVRVERGVSE